MPKIFSGFIVAIFGNHYLPKFLKYVVNKGFDQTMTYTKSYYLRLILKAIMYSFYYMLLPYFLLTMILNKGYTSLLFFH